IPTILTGLLPDHTGHWNLFYYDPQSSPFKFLRFLRFFPEWMVNNRIGQKMVKELGRRALGLGPTFECFVSPTLMPWFNWVERQDIYAPGGINGAQSIFDALSENGIAHRVYTYHEHSDAEILRLAEIDVREQRVQFFFLYLSELDHVLHDHW